MLNIIEPRYDIPSHTLVTQKAVPSLYEKEKSNVIHNLSKASAVVLTADGWTSRLIESYITVTAHHRTPEWNIASHVLLTQDLYEHTSTNIAEELKYTVLEQKLERPGTAIPLITDNARNDDRNNSCEDYFHNFTVFASRDKALPHVDGACH